LISIAISLRASRARRAGSTLGLGGGELLLELVESRAQDRDPLRNWCGPALADADSQRLPPFPLARLFHRVAMFVLLTLENFPAKWTA
jgi:hypothetical protein